MSALLSSCRDLASLASAIHGPIHSLSLSGFRDNRHKVQNMLCDGDEFVVLVYNGYVRNRSRSIRVDRLHLIAHLDCVADEYGLQEAHAVVARRDWRGLGSRMVKMGQDFG